MGENTITRIHSPDVAEVNMSESGEKQIKRNAVLYFDSKRTSDRLEASNVERDQTCLSVPPIANDML